MLFCPHFLTSFRRTLLSSTQFDCNLRRYILLCFASLHVGLCFCAHALFHSNTSVTSVKGIIVHFHFFACEGSGLLKMKVNSQTQDSFTISWSNPSIKIDDYKIYYRTTNGKWSSKDIKSGLDNKTLSAKVNGLKTGELYQVKVCVIYVFLPPYCPNLTRRANCKRAK